MKQPSPQPEDTGFTPADREHLRHAATLAEENIDTGGGPFGAVIVRDGEVLATGVNRVTPNNDPTAHAEVMAIRQACHKLGTFSLRGATIYSSCEPCPMCLSAIYWAGIGRIVYGNTQHDAARIGFSDHFIYEELGKPTAQRSLPCTHMENDFTRKAFDKWESKNDKTAY